MSNLELAKKFYNTFVNYRKTDVDIEIANFLDDNRVRFNYTQYSGFKQDFDENFETDSFAAKTYFNFFESGASVINVNPDNKDVELIGKGVIFDTGGYHVKQDYMSDMWFDDNGALLAIASAIAYGVKSSTFHTVNTPKILPGTILESVSSKHKIIIDDTDAEGRIGLAELLARHKSLTPAITLATLTGSACNTFGNRTYAALHLTNISNKKRLSIYKAILDKQLKMWPLPEHKDYNDSVKTKIKGATITNYNYDYHGAGSSTAFAFLKSFLHKKTPYAHLDIAPMMTDKNGNGLLYGLEEVKELIDQLTNRRTK